MFLDNSMLFERILYLEDWGFSQVRIGEEVHNILPIACVFDFSLLEHSMAGKHGLIVIP